MERAHVISFDDHFPIKPSDIDTTKFFSNVFSTVEVGEIASDIVRYFQKCGNHWGEFLLVDIRDLYILRNKHEVHTEHLFDLCFDELYKNNFVVQRNYLTRTHSVTCEFIVRCFKSSPATDKTIKRDHTVF